MEKIIQKILFLVLCFGFLQGNAQKLSLGEQINAHFENHAFDSVGFVVQNRDKEWAEILSSKSKIKKIQILRRVVMSALYMGELAKAKQYAIEIRHTDLFYEATYQDSEALKSLLRKHEIMPKIQVGVWGGANRSFVQPVGELSYVYQDWQGSTPDESKWENTKDYRGLYAWQAGLQMSYYLNRYLGFFGGLYYQRYQFEYQTLQKYKERKSKQDTGQKINYTGEETENTIGTLSDQVLHYYGGQFGVFVYKRIDKWNTKIYWQQGFAWAGLWQANRIVAKSIQTKEKIDQGIVIKQTVPAISPSTRTQESFYQNNWLGFSKIGISYQYRNFTLGIEGAYYQALSPISRLRHTQAGSLSLVTDYSDLLDAVNLRNIQANLTMAYTLKNRIK